MAEQSEREWVQRCARRIVEVDNGIDASEATEIACTAVAVERLRVMEPEAAVDFVLAQIARPTPSRYERRGTPRQP